MPDPLEKRTIHCPSCGGPTELKNRFVKLVVCQYCSQSLWMTPGGAEAHGKAAQLADLFTDLSLGAAAKLDGKVFSVQGRARFEYEDGFWDEWYVLFDDGTTGWLHEDEGELSLLRTIEQHDVTDLGPARVGSTFPINGKPAYVKEKRTAKIFSAEGQLPRALVFGAGLLYVDTIHDGQLMFLEQGQFDGAGIQLFVGRKLGDDAIEVY